VTVPFSADWRRPSPAFNLRRRSPPTPPLSTGVGRRPKGVPSAGGYSRHYSSTVDQRRPTPVACLRAAPRRRRSPPLGRRRLAPAYGPASAVACLRPVPRRRRSPPGPTLPPSTGAGRRAGVGRRPSPVFGRCRCGGSRPRAQLGRRRLAPADGPASAIACLRLSRQPSTGVYRRLPSIGVVAGPLARRRPAHGWPTAVACLRPAR